MKTASSRLSDPTTLEARGGLAILLLILLIVLVRSILFSYTKTFWYDETLTVILSHLPSTADIWGALGRAADNNPPIFYFVERLAGYLIPDAHIAYRLPSIFGVLITVVCVYFTLLKRVSRMAALAGATFLLCTPLADYAAEARPYALMVCCFAMAMVAWQHIDDSILFAAAFAVALAGALSMHYYAVLIWPAYIAAELSVWIFGHRFRLSAWAAIVAGIAPLVLFARLLVAVRQYYGPHFWAKPSIKLALTAHDWLFKTSGHWGWAFAVGVTAILLAVKFGSAKRFGLPNDAGRETAGIPLEELVLALMLLWLPLFAVAAAEIGHGGMAERYMLPAILGGALGVGFVIDRASSAGKVLLLLLFLMQYASSSVSLAAAVLHGSLLDDRVGATHEVDTIAQAAHEPDLPIVVTELEYLPIAYYTRRPDPTKRFTLLLI